MSLLPVVRLMPVRKSQFALFDSAFDRLLLGCVENTIVVRIILRDLGIHVGDMGEHHFRARLVTMRRRVSRKLQCAIGQSFREGFLLRRIELAVFIRVKRRDFREEFGEMFREGGRVRVVIIFAEIVSAVMTLGDCESGNGEANLRRAWPVPD